MSITTKHFTNKAFHLPCEDDSCKGLELKIEIQLEMGCLRAKLEVPQPFNGVEETIITPNFNYIPKTPMEKRKESDDEGCSSSNSPRAKPRRKSSGNDFNFS